MIAVTMAVLDYVLEIDILRISLIQFVNINRVISRLNTISDTTYLRKHTHTHTHTHTHILNISPK